MIVLDASVAVKAYIEEAGSEEATALLTGEQRLLAPALIRVEVAAAICGRVRRNEMKAKDALVRCADWQKRLERGLFTLTPDDALVAEAVALATELKHPLQDCLYLAVARREDATLITADKSFHKRAKPLFGKIALLPGCEGN
jgi:predicted nucleic acid-binding protein